MPPYNRASVFVLKLASVYLHFSSCRNAHFYGEATLCFVWRWLLSLSFISHYWRTSNMSKNLTLCTLIWAAGQKHLFPARHLSTQKQICTIIITKKIINSFIRFGKLTRTHREESCRQKPNISLHFWVPSETPAEEFLLADRAVNPCRAEQLPTTAEKHKPQVCHFSSPPQKQST